jgi:hypothetical protein
MVWAAGKRSIGGRLERVARPRRLAADASDVLLGYLPQGLAISARGDHHGDQRCPPPRATDMRATNFSGRVVAGLSEVDDG